MVYLLSEKAQCPERSALHEVTPYLEASCDSVCFSSAAARAWINP